MLRKRERKIEYVTGESENWLNLKSCARRFFKFGKTVESIRDILVTLDLDTFLLIVKAIFCLLEIISKVFLNLLEFPFII